MPLLDIFASFQPLVPELHFVSWIIKFQRKKKIYPRHWSDCNTFPYFKYSSLVKKFERALGGSEGQESLVCCSSWGCKELDTAWWLKKQWQSKRVLERQICSAPNLGSLISCIVHQDMSTSNTLCGAQEAGTVPFPPDPRRDTLPGTSSWHCFSECYYRKNWTPEQGNILWHKL